MYIVVVFRIGGMHYYPGHVSLNMPHFHRFHFQATIPEMSERDIEFIDFRNTLRQNFFNRFPKMRMDVKYKGDDYWNAPMVNDYGPRSCEDLAVILGNEIMKLLPDLTGEVTIFVMEHDRDAGVVYREEAENLVSKYTNLPEDRQ
ncbi:hypothetical protein D4R42_04760 [bacterium]|nr:MAG: hypothetical protein D4R42_04760 [bacterium]